VSPYRGVASGAVAGVVSPQFNEKIAIKKDYTGGYGKKFKNINMTFKIRRKLSNYKGLRKK
jgi:hypothetical protein